VRIADIHRHPLRTLTMVPAPPVLVVVGSGAGAEAGGGTRTDSPVLQEWEFVGEECLCCCGTWGDIVLCYAQGRKALVSFPLHRRVASSQPCMYCLHGPVDRGGLC
jgi:hypothetical protein